MIGNLEQGGTGQVCLPRTESDDCPHFSQQSAGKKKRNAIKIGRGEAAAKPEPSQSQCASAVKDRLLRARSASPACRGLKWIPESSRLGMGADPPFSKSFHCKASKKGTSESWINLEVEVEICRMKWVLQGRGLL